MIPAPTASITFATSEMNWSYVTDPSCHLGVGERVTSAVSEYDR